MEPPPNNTIWGGGEEEERTLPIILYGGHMSGEEEGIPFPHLPLCIGGVGGFCRGEDPHIG